MTNSIELEKEIKNFFQYNDTNYIKIYDDESIQKIHNFVINNNFQEPANCIEYFYFGKYYDKMKDYDLMKKYYLKAIDSGDCHAIYNLACYYHDIEDYDLMKKYYLMAIDKKDTDAMYNIAYYYKKINNYDRMKKYYLMAIELNSNIAMYGLGVYYQDIDEDYDLMKKYYLMAIELNNTQAMTNLANYHQTVDKDYDLMKKYYLMAIEQNNVKAMINLAFYYQIIDKDYDLMKKYYMMVITHHQKDKTLVKQAKNRLINYYKNNKDIISLIKFYHNLNMKQKLIMSLSKYLSTESSMNTEILDIIINLPEDYLITCPLSIKLLHNSLNEKINIIDLHFKYSLDGKGFDEARSDFISKITNN
jgi:tetratricopeptide (TPR) repeat protein